MIKRPLLGIFLWYLVGMLLIYYEQPIGILKILTIVLCISILLYFLITSYHQFCSKHNSNNNSDPSNKDNPIHSYSTGANHVLFNKVSYSSHLNDNDFDQASTFKNTIKSDNSIIPNINHGYMKHQKVQDNNCLSPCNKTFSWKLILKRLYIYWFLCLWPVALLFGYVRMESSTEEGVVDHMFQEASSVIGEVEGTISAISKRSWGEQIVIKDVTLYIWEGESVEKETNEERKDNTKNKEKENARPDTENRAHVKEYYVEKVLLQSSESSTLMVGNRIRIKGELNQFQSASNPGQFDEWSYYKNQGFDYKVIPDDIEVISSERDIFQNLLAKVKGRIAIVFEHILEAKEAGTMIAMLLGDKYLLDGEVSDLYQKNGLSHILAISGLHISLIGMSLHRFLKFLGVSMYIATPMSIAVVASYGVMTGMSVSTKRAVLMFILLLIAPIVSRTYDGISSLSFTGLILLIINPLDLFQAGFLLSFGAVVGITILYPALKAICPWKHPILDGIMVSSSAQLITTPIILWFFYQIPVYSILMNLIILPTSTILMLSALIAGILGCFSIPIGIFCIGGTNYILKFYEWVCRIGVSLPGAMYTVGRPKLWTVVMFYFVLILFLLQVDRAKKLGLKKESKQSKDYKHIECCNLLGFDKLHLRNLKLIKYPILKYPLRLITETKYLFLLILAMGYLCYPRRPEGFELTMVDVGQGDGILLRNGNVTYFVDGGSSNIKSVGKNRIQPLLLYKGIAKVDFWFLSHMDDDHINGMLEVMALGEIRIENVVLPKLWMEEKTRDNTAKIHQEIIEIADYVRGYGITVLFMERGDEIKSGNLILKALHPYKEYEAKSSNDMSLVLDIQYGEFDCLLTGDVEGKGELELITELRDYDVLKVAHHGSKNSTSDRFLEMVKAEYALISCSKKNRYGHPHEELLERLKLVESQVEITYETGAITIRTDGKRMKVERYMKDIK